MASQNQLTKNCDVNFTIVSFNVRGLRNRKKRRTLFHNFRKKNFDIICLQESHLLKSDVDMIEKDWGSKFHLSEGTKNSKGLLTLFGKNLQFSDLSLVKDHDRCLISNITFDELSFTVLNVYAPCSELDKHIFLNNVSDIISNLKVQFDSRFIVLGDFNTVLDNKLDIISGEPHSENIVKKFNTIVNDHLLVDIWRTLNGKNKVFTWSKKNPFIARRLDFILTSEDLVPFCKYSNILEIGFSDHRSVILNIDFSSFERGPSFYKFNKSLLQETALKNEISAEINRIKCLDMDPHLRWEYIKASIRDLGRMYGKKIAYEKRKTKTLLSSKINNIQCHLSTYPNDKEAVDIYHELKEKLEIFAVQEAEGARIRSGQKWAQEGEKCTRYFLSLEKQRSNSNTIFSLENSSGEIIRNPGEILDNIREHFINIYKKHDHNVNEEQHNQFIDDSDGNIINDLDKIILNHELTINELSYALKKSNCNSAPGSDGLAGEIYKCFWDDLKDPLMDCFNYSFEKGSLSFSQTKGIICLHHKGKGLSRDILGNWRPITLTNFDYKLLAKCMALRLNSCISKCIHSDQFAFIKGRHVGDLLREIDDILELGKKKFPESIILSLDYAKAFDTISISAVKKALNYFGFDGNYMKWVDIILHNRISCVQNGGYLSEYFQMERGVRQGCPISPLFFIITLELLARNIRSNDLIKGLIFSDSIIKIRLYADDATLFLRDMIDYREVLSRIKAFTSFSGLNLNKSKSTAMLIGNTGFKNQIRIGIKFKNSLKILGVIFSNECAANENPENYDNKILQLERLCSLWGKRCLTMIGRITVLKSFGISLFIYLMQSIGISDANLKRINTIVYNFIWNPHAKKGKKVIEKVKRDIITKNYENGGLNMIDIFKLQDSFLLKRGDSFFNPTKQSWKCFPNIYYKRIGGTYAFESNVQSRDFKGLELIESNYWKRVLIKWLDYKNQCHDVLNEVPSIHDPLMNNRYIKYKNKVIFNAKCVNLNKLYITDFLKQGEVIPFDDFNIILDYSADAILIYNTIFNALDKLKNQFKDELENNPPLEKPKRLFRDLEIGDISRRSFYEEIKDKKPEAMKEAWKAAFDLNNNDSIIWGIARECSYETKIWELQWKILQNIYPSGVLLNKMKIRNNDLCPFCEETDTLIHFFVTCPVAIAAWEEVNMIVSDICGNHITLTEGNKILGIIDHDIIIRSDLRKKINNIILVCKKTISKYKYEKSGDIKNILKNQLSFRNLL